MSRYVARQAQETVADDKNRQISSHPTTLLTLQQPRTANNCKAHMTTIPTTPSGRGGRRDDASMTPSGTRLSSSNSPFPSTPSVDRLNTTELQFALKDAWRSLREKERDCALAAEIGSKLLEANEQLKAEYERVLFEYEQAVARLPAQGSDGSSPDALPSPPASQQAHGKSRPHAHGEDLTVNHMFELEKINQELQQKYDALSYANSDLERAAALHEKKLEDQAATHKREMATALNAIRELERDKAQMAREKAEIAKHVKDGKKMAGDEAAYVARIDELENLVADLTVRAEEAETKLNPALQEVEMWSSRCRDLEERFDGIENLQDDLAMQQLRVEELESKLADEREIVASLKAFINGDKSVIPSNLAAIDVYDDDENAHSLFSEVEDKRLALESRHSQLAAKHKGLMKVHHQNVHQQERLRNHINRLTQLTQSRTDEERLQRLEQALGEKDSENRALFARIAALERGGAVADPGIGTAGSGSSVSGSIDSTTVETLRLRLSTLESECEYLRGELRTLKMLRVGEIEKLRKTERALGEKEEEIERLRNEAAKWKWEAEEAKVMLQEKNQMNELVSDTQVEVLEAGGEQKRRRHIASQTDEDDRRWAQAPVAVTVAAAPIVSSSVLAVVEAPPAESQAPDNLMDGDEEEDEELGDQKALEREFTIRSIKHDLESDTSSSGTGSLNMDNTFSNVTAASLKAAGHTQTRASLLVAVTSNNLRREVERTGRAEDGSPAGGELAANPGRNLGPEPTPMRPAAGGRGPLAEALPSIDNVPLSTGPRRQRIPTAERGSEQAEPPQSTVKRPEPVVATGSAQREPIGASVGGRAPKQVFVNKKGGSSAPSSAEKQEECKQQ